MKKLIILSTLLFLSTSNLSFGQTVNGIPISEIDVEYVQINTSSKGISRKMKIDIDFGQENKMLNSKDTRIIDINGASMVFNSVIDALNFMSKNGYELLTTYTTLTEKNAANIYHYILRKKK